MHPANTTRSHEEQGTVLIVDDQIDEGVRDIVRAYVSPFTDVRYEAGIRSGIMALEKIERLLLALIDLNMPGGAPFDMSEGTGGGFEVVRRARKMFPDALLFVYTAHVSEAVVKATYRAGAEFLCKEYPSHNLQIIADRALALAGVPAAPSRAALEMCAKEHKLSPRQKEVLWLLANNKSQTQAAEELDIKRSTVKSHVEMIVDKCCSASMVDVTRTLLHTHGWRASGALGARPH